MALESKLDEGLLEECVQGQQSIFSREPLKWLPKWAYDKEVAALMESQAAQGKDTPMMCVAGASIWYARRAVELLWTFFILFPCIAYPATTCPSGDHGFARVNSALLWSMFLPVIITALWLENACLRIVLPVQLHTTAKFKGPFGYNFTDRPFWQWRLYTLGTSAVCMAAIASTTMFTVKVLKTSYCATDEAMEVVQIWRDTMRQSSLRWIPGIDDLSLCSLMIAGWLFMLLEVVGAIVRTYPLGPRIGAAAAGPDWKVSYVAAVDKSHVFEYRTMVNPMQNHGSALQALASASHMAGVTFQDMKYARKRMDVLLEKNKSYSSIFASRYLHHAEHRLGTELYSLLVVGLLESALQLNFQVTMLAVTREAQLKGSSSGLAPGYDLQTLFSVLVSVGFALIKTYNASTVFHVIDEVKTAVTNGRKGEMVLEPLSWTESLYGLAEMHFTSLVNFIRRTEDPKADDLDDKNFTMRWQLLQVMFILFLVAVWLHRLAIAYGVIKIVALFACDSGLFNITGCVEL